MLFGQKTQVIYLENPSFEDIPGPGRTPRAWTDCGAPQESPPDVQPYGGFNVTRPAQNGRTFVGLVGRDNSTWEAVAQRLNEPLSKGTCYKFSIQACKSPIYLSPTRKNQTRPTNFKEGMVIRIWAGNTACANDELLDEVTQAINHYDWRAYDFEFTPKNADYNYFKIEAYYKTPILAPYNGNVLIDHASEIFSCQIPTDEPIVANDPKKEDPKDPIKKTDPFSKPDPTPKDDPVKKTPNTSAENLVAKDKGNFDPNAIDIKAMKVGDKFRLENLYFQADSASITRNAERVLAGLYEFLKANPSVSLEVGGHTNGLPPEEYCDRLSTQRAKNVVAYLRRRGIEGSRMGYRGYGKRKPISDNETAAGRRRNQRVEIIITDIDGDS
jgi:outer membrane protein OmpA-like peptidoglycan-associated protein